MGCIQIVEIVMMKTYKKKEVEQQIEEQESQMIEQRKGLSKQYP